MLTLARLLFGSFDSTNSKSFLASFNCDLPLCATLRRNNAVEQDVLVIDECLTIEALTPSTTVRLQTDKLVQTFQIARVLR